MIVAIHQPQFMPWLGYFAKMDRADCFVLLDNVQFKKNEWQNRNRIKGARGAQWLTVPVSYTFPALISEVAVNQQVPWRRKHWQALLTCYSKAAHWEEARASLEELYRRPWERLVEVNGATIAWLKEKLGIGTPVRRASGMALGEEPTQRLVDICRALGAHTYLSGVDGRQYMEVERFARAGIEVIYQEFEHPRYAQMYGEFQSHLSALDLVLNCGPASLEILRRGQKN